MAEPFGSLLRRFRTRSGLNLSELAEALGANRMSIRAWERGYRVPRDRARLEDLAQVLRLTSDEADQLADAARQHRFRLAGAALPAAVPATGIGSSGLVMRYQLRAPIADFVGRAIEVESLVAALQATLAPRGGAIISGVQGMGGVGKTELAYLVAHQVRETFPDAQIVLNLRGTSATPLPAEQALQNVIRTFLPDATLPDELEALQARYLAVLHGQQALILADDARDAVQVYPLLPPAGCALLITSRMRFSLPGMATLDLEHLSEEEALALLQGICGRLGKSEALALARACGYLPLGLRVSGSLLRNDPALSLTNYLSGLAGARLRLSQLRDPDDPRLDVESSLGLSYTLLDGAAQRVFRQLGVIVADFATELALAMVGADADICTEDMLHRLLRRNLIMYDAGRQRWRLHDLVREIARDYLERAGEWEPTMWRYARAAIQIAHETQTQYLTGGEGILASLARFDAERPHIDAARHWAAAHAGTLEGDTLLVEDAAATVNSGHFRYDRRHERIPQLERALAAARRLDYRCGEAQVLNSLGRTHMYLGDGQRALPYLEQALALARGIGDQRGESNTLNNLGHAYYFLGDARRCITSFEQALAIRRVIGDRRGEGGALGNLGCAYLRLGDVRRAIAYLEQALAIVHTVGDLYLESDFLNSLGHAYIELGDARRGIESCEVSLRITRAVGDRRGEGYVLSSLGYAYATLGEMTRATSTCEQARSIFQEVGDRHGMALCGWYYGLALARRGEREQAMPFLQACVAYEEESGHAHAAERAALLARLVGREELPEKALL